MFNSNYRKTIILGSYSLLITILSLFIVSCDDDDDEMIIIPVANFDSEITFLEVAFTDASNDAETYRWDFGVDGDEDISTDASPSFTYSEAGTYTVTLIVANSTGGSDVQQEEITVRAPILPTANFTVESGVGLDVSFENSAENADTFLWDFGVDGVDTDTSTVADPTFTFPAEGDFDVSLTVTSTDGFTDTETKTITVSRVAVIPIAEFSFEATDLAVTFTDASSDAVSYAWDFGVDGTDTDVSTEASPSFTYPTFGTYEVSLTVTSSTGDTDTETMSVMVSLPAPVADFTFVASDLEVTFTNTSTNAETFSWDFGDSSPANTEESPTHTYAAGGEYTVTLTATTADNQTDTQVMQVEVIDPAANTPVADFTFAANLLEVTFTDQSLNAVSYAWDFGDGNSSMMASPVHTYAAAGTYTVSLTITNSEAAMDTETMMVEVVDGVGPGNTGNQVAAISDTNDGGTNNDTGELRLDISETSAGADAVVVGRMTVSVFKEVETTGEDGFVSIWGSSTSSSNNIMDLRLETNNDVFQIRDQDAINTSISDRPFVEGEWIEIEITWDASSVSETPLVTPLVTVSIDGQPVTMNPFNSQAGAAFSTFENGIETIQFRLAGGSATASSRFLIDELKIYSSDSGSEVMIFEDDFEGYTLGESLDPDGPNPVAGTPYRNNSFEVVVAAED
ncbi:MAG: PKD domain-containing protein [Bacteroidota bacterium]